jgi:hypothetical protein
MNEESLVGEGKQFQRIRRITGYLVGDLSRFNTAKRHEVEERVKHTFTQPSMQQFTLLKQAQ